MSRISDGILRHKRSVILIFTVLTAVSALLSVFVRVNYRMADYLPDDAPSTAALRVLQDEFDEDLTNARVMLSDVTILEALEYKDEIAALDGVASVMWLDDVVGRDTLMTTPVEYLDPSVLKAYYRESSALISLSIEDGKDAETVSAIRTLIGPENAVAGDAVNMATTQMLSVSEVLNAMAILVPVILVILILSTGSWIEPLLFVAAIGIAILINMGTNLLFGEVSFITQAVSPILQMAVSLDYAIFLLHSFNDYRMQYDPPTAMKYAMKKSVSAIAASAATTVFGFLALLFMRFRIGADLGINLVKGVTLSFITVMVLLPALTLACYKLIDKTKHRKIIPDFNKLGSGLAKISAPFLILAILIAVPCFLAQSNIEFNYGTDDVAKASSAGDDAARIDRRFGKENPLVLLVPNGSTGKEAELCRDLAEIGPVTSVVAYVTSVGAEIPTEYVDRQIVDRFYSEHYARILLYPDMDPEGPEAFETVRAVNETAARYYDESYLAGQSATLYDLKNTISFDIGTVNLCAVIGIFLVLLLTFKSLTAPLFLIFTIEAAIWINLSFAYFAGQSFNFIGYLVISTVQLGSTVDYAILMTDRYTQYRKELPPREAARKAFGENFIAVLISAAILSTAGFTLAMTSSNSIIAELGILLGRGTLLSLLMVVCVLPSLLVFTDKVMRKTTLQSGWRKNRKGKSGGADL